MAACPTRLRGSSRSTRRAIRVGDLCIVDKRSHSKQPKELCEDRRGKHRRRRSCAPWRRLCRQTGCRALSSLRFPLVERRPSENQSVVCSESTANCYEFRGRLLRGLRAQIDGGEHLLTCPPGCRLCAPADETVMWQELLHSFYFESRCRVR